MITLMSLLDPGAGRPAPTRAPMTPAQHRRWQAELYGRLLADRAGPGMAEEAGPRTAEEAGPRPKERRRAPVRPPRAVTGGRLVRTRLTRRAPQV